MKLFFLWVAASLAVASAQTARTVNKPGGGANNYTTIQLCASAMANGDTCTVYAGTYNESVNIPADTTGTNVPGAAGNSYKTIQANASDVVLVNGTITINSYTRVIGNCSVPASLNSCGFQVGNGSRGFTVGTNAHDAYIDHNMVYGGQFLVSGHAGPGSDVPSYIRYRYNTGYYSGGTPASPNTGEGMNLVGDHYLFQGNDWSHTSDFVTIGGHWFIFLNNVFHDVLTSECGSGASNCHIDAIQAEQGAGYAAQFYVAEGNTIRNWTVDGCNLSRDPSCSGPANHAGVLAQCSNTAGVCSNFIWRYNIDYSIGGGAMTNDYGPVAGSNPTQGWPIMKIYNNTWVDMAIGNGTIQNHQGTPNTDSNLNSIYYWNTAPGTSWWAYYANGGSTPTPFQWSGYNMAFSATGGTILPWYQGGSGSFATPGFAENPGHNVVANPLFVNYAGKDFHLSGTSPALAAGTYLTTANGAGNGSSNVLTVLDAANFADGYGFAVDGIQADWIRIGDANAPVVQIAAWGSAACGGGSCIGYSTSNGTGTGNPPITVGTQQIVLNCTAGVNCPTWSNLAHVYLYKKSDGALVLPQGQAAPDLGALPNVSAVVLSNNPSSVAFGNVQSGQTGTLTTVTVSNVGSINAASIACSITGTNANQFTLSGTCPGTLNFGANFTQTVNCAPAGAGSFSANLTINDASDGVMSSTALSCTGTTQAPNLANAPASISFGNQDDGTTSATQNVTITNNGTGLATISSCALTGTNANQFTLTGVCSGTLAINANFTQTVAFAPTTAGAKSATLTITYDAGATSTAALTGTGIDPNQITKVQVTTCGPKVFPSTCTITSTGSGHMIIPVINSGVGFAPTITSITDNQGNTYQEAGAARSIDANTGDISDIWYAANTTAGATTLTITPSASGTLALVIYEVSNVTTLDQVAVLNSQAAATSPVGPSVMIGASQEFIVSNISVQNSVSGIFSGNPFTNDSLLFGNGWSSLITSSTGAYNAKWNAVSGTYSGSTASFRQAAAVVNTPGGLSLSGSVAGAEIRH